MRPLHLSLFRNQYDQTHPKFLSWNWPEIVQHAAQPPATAKDREKWSDDATNSTKRYCALVPHTSCPWMPRQRHMVEMVKGYSRCNQNVLGKDLLILDIDNDASKERPHPDSRAGAIAIRRVMNFPVYVVQPSQPLPKEMSTSFCMIFLLATYCSKTDWELRRRHESTLAICRPCLVRAVTVLLYPSRPS